MLAVISASQKQHSFGRTLILLTGLAGNRVAILAVINFDARISHVAEWL